MTKIIQKGINPTRATIFQRIFGRQTGGCIFIHENMLAIFDEHSSELPVPNTYDAIIITKERPVSVVTVLQNGEIDAGTIKYNKILSNRLKLALQRFTVQIITTICATVEASALNGKKLIKMLDTKVEEDSYRLLAEQLHMDERKLDYVTRAFVACLAFMTHKPVKSDSDSKIPGSDTTLLCVNQPEFLTRYSLPPFEISGKELERMHIAAKVANPIEWLEKTVKGPVEFMESNNKLRTEKYRSPLTSIPVN